MNQRIESLIVRLSGQYVGRLLRNQAGHFVFKPERQWLDCGQDPVLSLAHLRSPNFRGERTGISRWFEHLLPHPEGALRRKVSQMWNIRGTGSAQILAVLGRDLPGSVVIEGEPRSDDVASSLAVSPEAPLFTFSLAGMQLKFSMERQQDRFCIPAQGQYGSWIVKLPSQNYPDLPEVELATMKWAAACGFPVPECQVIPVEMLQGIPPSVHFHMPLAFAILRFDRPVDAPRRHQEDFAQALESGIDEIYGKSGARRIGYEVLARLVADACNQSTCEQFIERLAFVVASGNGDAHLKNWSFQWKDDQRPDLSPCYDQVSTIVWDEFACSGITPPTLALPFAGTDAFADLTLARLRSFAEKVGMPSAVDRFIAALVRSRRAFESIGSVVPTRMHKALKLHWSNVPLLRELEPLAD